MPREPQDRTHYCCAVIAGLIWLVDGAKVVRDQLNIGNADWVPFLAFTGLMVLLAVPVLLDRDWLCPCSMRG